MAVHIDEVEVDVDEQARDPQRSAPPAGSHAGAAGSQLAVQIDRTIALLRSRNLRLWAD
jgi:hypothetical protein